MNFILTQGNKVTEPVTFNPDSPFTYKEVMEQHAIANIDSGFFEPVGTIYGRTTEGVDVVFNERNQKRIDYLKFRSYRLIKKRREIEEHLADIIDELEEWGE